MAAKKSAKRGKAPKATSKTKKRATKPAPKRVAKKPAPKKKAAPKKPVAKTKAAPKKPAPKKKAAPKKPAPTLYANVTLPELPEIEGYARSLPPPILVLVNKLRQLVRDAAPEAKELLDPSGPAYEANGLFARIEANDREVLVMFLKGAHLEAPDGTLAGDGEIRSLAVESVESLRESVLQGLVRQAVLLNVREPSGAV